MPFTPEQHTRRSHTIERAFALAKEQIFNSQPLLLDVYDRGTDGRAHRARLLFNPETQVITLESFADSTELPTLLHGLDFIYKLVQELASPQLAWPEITVNYVASGTLAAYQLQQLHPIRILMTVQPVAKHLVVAHKQDRHVSAAQLITEYQQFLAHTYAEQAVLFPVCALLLTYRHGQTVPIDPPAKGELSFAALPSNRLNQPLAGFDRIHPGRIKNDLLPSDNPAL